MANTHQTGKGIMGETILLLDRDEVRSMRAAYGHGQCCCDATGDVDVDSANGNESGINAVMMYLEVSDYELVVNTIGHYGV